MKFSRFLALSFFIFIFLFAPLLVGAVGIPLVPCGTALNTDPCNFCSLLDLFSNIISFIAFELTPAAFVGLIVYAGVMYLTYSTNPGNLEKAKGILKTAIIGFLWILFAWFLINLILQILGNKETNSKRSFNFLHKFECPKTQVDLPDGRENPSVSTGGASPTTASGTGGREMTITEIRAAIDATSKYDDLINKYAAKYNIPPERLRAIIVAESRGLPGEHSPAGAIGLMQVLPSTAAEVAKELGLKNPDFWDPETNINIGAKYYANLLEQTKNYSTNATADRYDIASAAYNGGVHNPSLSTKAALEISTDCTEQRTYAYQCRTRPGGLNETYFYTINIDATEEAIRRTI